MRSKISFFLQQPDLKESQNLLISSKICFTLPKTAKKCMIKIFSVFATGRYALKRNPHQSAPPALSLVVQQVCIYVPFGQISAARGGGVSLPATIILRWCNHFLDDFLQLKLTAPEIKNPALHSTLVHACIRGNQSDIKSFTLRLQNSKQVQVKFHLLNNMPRKKSVLK